jgi:hypothetical protein
MARKPVKPAAPGPRSGDSRRKNPPASKKEKRPADADRKQDADDIRRAVDDGMQDLRMKKPE